MNTVGYFTLDEAERKGQFRRIEIEATFHCGLRDTQTPWVDLSAHVRIDTYVTDEGCPNYLHPARCYLAAPSVIEDHRLGRIRFARTGRHDFREFARHMSSRACRGDRFLQPAPEISRPGDPRH